MSEKSNVVVISDSLYVRIPARIMRHAAFDPTDAYSVTIDSQGALTFTPSERVDTLCLRCEQPRSDHARPDTGKPVCYDGKRFRYTH